MLVLPSVSNVTQKVADHHLQSASANLQSDAERPFWVQAQWNGGLPNLASNARLFDDQFIGQQAVDNDGNGLRGQLGQPRQIGFGDGAGMANGAQHDAFIELTHAVVVGASHRLQHKITPLHNMVLPNAEPSPVCTSKLADLIFS